MGTTGEQFRWATPLAASVAMFLVIGALWLVVGVLSVALANRGDVRVMFVSARADTQYFGRDSGELIASDPVMSKYGTLMITVIGGLLLLAGTLVVSLAWFGLRWHEAWALGALATGGLFALAFWALALSYYLRAGVSAALADAPPFISVPAVLLVPATALGWIGLR